MAGDTIGAWREPDWAVLLGDTVVGQQLLPFAETSFLHHLIVSQGTIIDFFVQSVDHPISRDAQLIIKCNDAFGDRSVRQTVQNVQTCQRPIRTSSKPLLKNSGSSLTQHAKVLFRNLDVLALAGIEFERALLTCGTRRSLEPGQAKTHRPPVHPSRPHPARAARSQSAVCSWRIACHTRRSPHLDCQCP